MIARYSNGATSSSATVSLSNYGATLGAGDVLVVAKNQSSFESRFGTSLNVIYSSTVDVNGDDALALEDASGTILDVFGEIGVDGSGTAWEYENTCANRDGAAYLPRHSMPLNGPSLPMIRALRQAFKSTSGRAFSRSVPSLAIRRACKSVATAAPA